MIKQLPNTMGGLAAAVRSIEGGYGSAGAVVAEGEGLRMAATRRLQLAARAEYGVKGVPACLVVGADDTVIHRSRSIGRAKRVIAEALEPTNGHTNCLVPEPPELRTRSTLGLANYSFSAG